MSPDLHSALVTVLSGEPSYTWAPSATPSTISPTPMRHDKLTKVWRRCLQNAGAPSAEEPRYGRMAASMTAAELAGLHRGDFSALIGGRLVVGDVVVAHPAAALYARAVVQMAWQRCQARG